MMRRPPRSALLPCTTLFRSLFTIGGGLGAVMGIGIQHLFPHIGDRKSTRLNSSHSQNSYAVFCLKKRHDRIPTPRQIAPHRHMNSTLTTPLHHLTCLQPPLL